MTIDRPAGQDTEPTIADAHARRYHVDDGTEVGGVGEGVVCPSPSLVGSPCSTDPEPGHPEPELLESEPVRIAIYDGRMVVEVLARKPITIPWPSVTEAVFKVAPAPVRCAPNKATCAAKSPFRSL